MSSEPIIDAPFFEPDADTERAIAARHGLQGEWKPLGPRGEVHSVYRVGNAVVRIPRNGPDWVCDTLTEVVALQALAGTNVATPALRGFDNQLDLVPVPYCVIDYFPGHPVKDWADASAQTLGALGAAIASLHTEVSDVPDPHGWLDDVGLEESFRDLSKAMAAGTISASDADWAEGLLKEIEGSIHDDLEQVFVHNDIHELNILVGGNEIALIDWGDAGWGDPSYDFATLPPPWVRAVIAEYTRHRPLSSSACARIAWNQLGLSLRRLAGRPAHVERGQRRLTAIRAEIGALL